MAFREQNTAEMFDIAFKRPGSPVEFQALFHPSDFHGLARSVIGCTSLGCRSLAIERLADVGKAYLSLYFDEDAVVDEASENFVVPGYEPGVVYGSVIIVRSIETGQGRALKQTPLSADDRARIEVWTSSQGLLFDRSAGNGCSYSAFLDNTSQSGLELRSE